MATTEFGRDPAYEGQVQKAGHIAMWCRRNGVTADQVERWTDGQWLAAAEAIRTRAGYKSVRMPTRGGRTRSLVVQLLRHPPDSSVHPGVR